MIELAGKTYYINIDELFKLIEYSNKTETKEQEITDGYEYDEDEKKLTAVSKMVREIKTPADSQTDNIRYDFIKMMIGQIISSEENVLDFGTEICFNTLIKKGILVELKK
jgi:hypothetical protein